MPSTPLAYRLVIPGPGSAFVPGDLDAAINAATDFYVTSLRRIDHPFIESAPSGEGTSLDFLTGQVTDGELQLRVIDVDESDDGTAPTSVGDDFEGDTLLSDSIGRGWTYIDSGSGVAQLRNNTSLGLDYPEWVTVITTDATVGMSRTFPGLVPGALYNVTFRFHNLSYEIAFSGSATAQCGASSNLGSGSTGPLAGGSSAGHVLVPADFTTAAVQVVAGSTGDLTVTFELIGDAAVQVIGGLDYVLLTLIPGTGATAGRYVTKWLADANARQQLLNRGAYVDISPDAGATWLNARRGFVTSLVMQESLVYDFTIGDTRRTERTRKAFRNIDPTAAGAPFTKVTPILGGPVFGGFAPKIPNVGLPLYEVTAITPMAFSVPGNLTLKYITGPLPDDFNSTFPRGPENGLETVTTRAAPFLVNGNSFYGIVDGAPQVGQFPRLRGWLFNPLTGAVTAFPGMMPLGRFGGTLTNPGDKKISFEFLLGAPVTLPSVGQRYGLMIAPLDISEKYPLHWSGHPVDFVTTLYTLAGIPFDTGSAAACRDSLGGDNCSCLLHFTDPEQTMQAAIEQVGGFHRFATRSPSDDIEITFIHYGERIATTPAFSLTTADLAEGGGPTFELDTQSIVNRVVVNTTLMTAFAGKPFEERPADAIVISTLGNIVLDYSSDGGVTLDADNYGEHEATFALPGSPAWGPGPTELNLAQYAKGLARDVFGHAARGVQFATLQLIAGIDLSDVGDPVEIDVDHMPNAQLGQSPISQRGGARWMKIVRQGGSAARQVYRFVDESTGVAYGSVVTLSVTDNADDPLHAKDVEITGTGQLVTDGAHLEFEVAFGASMPTGHGTRATILDPVEMPTDPWTEIFGNLPPGENVWFRAWAYLDGGAPGAWSAWTDNGGSIPTPTGDISALIIGTPTTDGAPLSWTNPNTTSPVKAEVRLTGAPVYTFVTLLAATSVQYTLTGLADTTAYDVRVVLMDPVLIGVEVGVPLTGSFTTAGLGGATQVPTPINPRAFAGSYANGYLQPGVFGIVVTAVFPPASQYIEIEIATETAIGSGTPGGFISTTPAPILPALVGQETGAHTGAPNDGLKRYIKAKSVAVGYTDSAYTATFELDPWSGTPTIPPPTLGNLDDLNDVTVPAPGNGDLLAWNSGLAVWENVAPSSTAALDDLTDVNAPSPTLGDVLTFDGTDWVPQAPTGGSSGVDVDFYFQPEISPHADSDEFEDGSLDARWTESHNSPSYAFNGDGALTITASAADTKMALGQLYSTLATNPPDGAHPLSISVATSRAAASNNNFSGIYISDGTKLYLIGVLTLDHLLIASYSGWGAVTFNTTHYDSSGPLVNKMGPATIRAQDDGTNIKLFMSSNGFAEKEVASFVRSYLTPTEFGIFAVGVDATFSVAFHSFRVTQP